MPPDPEEERIHRDEAPCLPRTPQSYPRPPARPLVEEGQSSGGGFEWQGHQIQAELANCLGHQDEGDVDGCSSGTEGLGVGVAE